MGSYFSLILYRTKNDDLLYHLRAEGKSGASKHSSEYLKEYSVLVLVAGYED